MMNKRSSYFIFADILRIFAIVGVVAIHSSNYILYSGLYSHGVTWWFAALLRSTSRVSVPLFVMLSGFLLWGLAKNQRFPVIANKAVHRLLIPLLFWYTATVCWQSSFWHNSVPIPEILLRFWQTNITHLYYLQALIGLYLSLPFLIKIDRKLPQKYKWILVFGLFIYSSVLTLLSAKLPHLPLINLVTIFTLYLGYFYVGKLCFSLKITSKITWMALAVFIVTAALNASGMQNFLFNNFQNLENYSAMGVVIMSVALFLFLRGLEPQWKKWFSGTTVKIISKVAASTYGIYLVHYIVKDIIERYVLIIGTIRCGLLFYLMANITTVLVVSLVFTEIMRKFVVTKKMVGG